MSPVLRPAHQQPLLLLLVGIGGMVGTLGRYLLSQARPPVDGWPVATLIENLTGALLLGALLEVCGRFDSRNLRVQRVRLTLGTGVLGGYTTFSALALETERLLTGGAVGQAVVYGLGSVVGGALAALAGIALVRRPRSGARPVGPGPEDDAASGDGVGAGSGAGPLAADRDGAPAAPRGADAAPGEGTDAAPGDGGWR